MRATAGVHATAHVRAPALIPVPAPTIFPAVAPFGRPCRAARDAREPPNRYLRVPGNNPNSGKEDIAMRNMSFTELTSKTQLHIQGLEQRPALADAVPYPLTVVEPSHAKLLRLQSGRVRLDNMATATTAKIHDLAYTLRGMLNANVAYAVSVVGSRSTALKDLAGTPSKSRMRKAAAPGSTTPTTASHAA
jgi:hypothetical protein